jgi:hypothetical protein
VLDLSSFDLEEIGNVLADQTDYEHRWQWLADNSLIDDDVQPGTAGGLACSGRENGDPVPTAVFVPGD